MNSLLPDNKSWINRILQKNMCKLLLQAAILAIHLPFTCDMPDGFTIKCTDGSTTCEGSSCGWNGFNSCNEKVNNNEQFVCPLHKATGQYSCNLDSNNDDEEAFCNSSEQCGFQDSLQNGKCIITRTPGPDTDKGCSANRKKGRMNSGASTGTIGSWIAVILIMVVGHSMYLCTQIPSRPGGQNSRAQSDEPNGGKDSGDITIPLQQQSPCSTDDCAPGPGN